MAGVDYAHMYIYIIYINVYVCARGNNILCVCNHINWHMLMNIISNFALSYPTEESLGIRPDIRPWRFVLAITIREDKQNSVEMI